MNLRDRLKDIVFGVRFALDQLASEAQLRTLALQWLRALDLALHPWSECGEDRNVGPVWVWWPGEQAPLPGEICSIDETGTVELFVWFEHGLQRLTPDMESIAWTRRRPTPEGPVAEMGWSRDEAEMECGP